ncbi:MAG: HlyD family efflux transporter periplasmic adaptor subunit [Pirellulaceae bacterium]|nr:HlyD family efflux transporter periplasmic adaptor subunit [Pirellulaceae bacterium]
MKRFPRRLPLYFVLLGLAALLAYGFWPVPVEVEVAQADRGSLVVTVDDDGKTRIREKYVVSAPVGGKLFRIDLEEGDAVEHGVTVLARIEPGDPALLDARAEAEALARVQASEAGVRQADASLLRASEAHHLALNELTRARQLIQARSISTSEFDEREHQERMAQADLKSAEFGVAVANFELELTKAALIRSRPGTAGEPPPGTLTITSPIDGQVLRVLQENAGVVTPGAALIEIGDPHDLEMEIDVLSTDAVRIQPGAQVLVEHWGGGQTLEGAVRMVEPSAFLKISALGVEEQRVNVIADFTSPYEQRRTLGDGYRIEARIVVDQAQDVVKVPVGTLFHQRGQWHVYRIARGHAELQPVEIGISDGRETEIIQGLSAGDQLVVYPTDQVRSGVRVRGG